MAIDRTRISGGMGAIDKTKRKSEQKKLAAIDRTGRERKKVLLIGLGGSESG